MIKKILVASICGVLAMAMPPSEMPTESDHSPEQIAKSIEVDISPNLPKKLSDSITFKNIQAFGNKLVYSYQVFDTPKAEFSKFSWQAIEQEKKIRHEGVMRTVCAAEDARAMLNLGVVMEYRYTLENGNFFYQFKVSKEDCERNKF